MSNLVLKAAGFSEILTHVALITATSILASEQDGQTVYVAAQRQGLTTALILRITPIPPLADGSNVIVSVQGENDNPPHARAGRDVTRHLTPPSDLFTPDTRWRERCQTWQARLKSAGRGETLLGEYPEAEGGVSYNDVGKEAFARDARRYARKLLSHLGWPGAVHFNPGGIAVSGEVILRATPPGGDCTLFLELSCSCWVPVPTSPSGVSIMWRFEPTDGRSAFERPFGNRWASWLTPSADLARFIQDAHGQTGLARSA